MRTYEEHILSLQIARHRPNGMADDLTLPAPTKFKRDNDSKAHLWKFGRSHSAPSLKHYPEKPREKNDIVIAENVIIKAVTLVRF